MQDGVGSWRQQITRSFLMVCLAVIAVFGGHSKSGAQKASHDITAVAEGAKLGAEPGQKKPGGAGVEGDEMVIIGASYVRAWPVQELGGMRVVNKGVNGEQSFEMLKRFGDDVMARKPKAVIIWGFINDVHRTKREGIEAAMARARESIAEMVRLARKQIGDGYNIMH